MTCFCVFHGNNLINHETEMWCNRTQTASALQSKWTHFWTANGVNETNKVVQLKVHKGNKIKCNKIK